ncbi:MAG TPA: LysR family transcriptional regulator [Rhizomicrobium sp.]|nr:LysR family transcriptional regulator [Rhizomicrobium sp.]
MNLKQLEYAAAVAANNSFSVAAEACHVTQPTLSSGVAELEAEMGGRLFSRTTRSVALTPLGTHLLPYIKEVINARDTLSVQSKSFLNPAQKILRIGMSPLVDAKLLGLMLDPFKRENPVLELVLREMNMADLYRMLDEGLLDYVFGVSAGHKDRWNSAFLYDEPLLYVPGGGNRRTDNSKSISFKDIAEDVYVMVPDACGLARATRALFRSQRKPLNEYKGEAMSYQVLEDWAALNIGSAILPGSKVTKSTKVVRTIKTKDNDVVRIAFEAIWPREREQSKHLAAFEKHLRTVAPKIVQGLASE